MSDHNSNTERLPSWLVPAGEYRAKALTYVLGDPWSPSELNQLMASIEFEIVEDGPQKGKKVTWNSNLPGKDNLGMAALNRTLQVFGVDTTSIKDKDLSDPPINYDKIVSIVVDLSKSKDGSKTYCNVKWVNDPDRPRGSGKSLSERVKPLDMKDKEAKAKAARLAVLLMNTAKSTPAEDAPPASRGSSKSAAPTDDDIPF